MLPRIEMTVDPTLRADAPALTQSRVTIRLRDGAVVEAGADGARGYPAKPASAPELEDKFRACAGRVFDAACSEGAIAMLRSMEQLAETRVLTEGLRTIMAP
jgi:2-methylcitrate dehydratase PrpD